MLLDARQTKFLAEARVGRLATCSLDLRPHCVPICFALVGDEIWIPLDEKPKTGRALRRVRNIEENPQVSLIFDHYEEDWSKLRFLLLEGKTSLCPLEDSVLKTLRSRYPQYQEMDLSEGIRIRLERAVGWEGD